MPARFDPRVTPMRTGGGPSGPPLVDRRTNGVRYDPRDEVDQLLTRLFGALVHSTRARNQLNKFLEEEMKKCSTTRDE
jgi:hypothetical protein